MTTIRKVGILGSGTMGCGIAIHLANVGISSVLLDIVPNHISNTNLMNATKSKPPQLMDADGLNYIRIGNMEDDLDSLSECDWIVEAVTEKLEIKKQVLQKIIPYLKPTCIISTNTSGIPVNQIAAVLPKEFRQRWLGTHFFNPVRYMRLLEIIPGSETLSEVIEQMICFGERFLGKNVICAKDTPNFIANRIAQFNSVLVGKLLEKTDITVPEADMLTGKGLGGSGSATFGTVDLAGLDIFLAAAHVNEVNIPDAREREGLKPSEFFYKMLECNLLGNKTNGGFYRKEGQEKKALNIHTFQYETSSPRSFPSITLANQEKTVSGKLETIFSGNDPGSEFLWRLRKGVFLYAAAKVQEIADEIIDVDRAVRWGYNNELGPFEMWEGLDLAKYIARMEAEGDIIPTWIKEMLSTGHPAFYKKENGLLYYYSISGKCYKSADDSPATKINGKVYEAGSSKIAENKGAFLCDLGNGILCLVMKNPTMNSYIAEMLNKAQEELHNYWEGLVITSNGNDFSFGLDFTEIVPDKPGRDWSRAENLLKNLQDLFLKNKYSYKPVIAATRGKVLGCGCELAMQCSSIQSSAEVNFGLADFGLGLIPACGGTKELVIRGLEKMYPIKGTRVFQDFLEPAFNNIAMAKVSGCAKEGIKLGYLKETDGISFNSEHLLADAKTKALHLIENNYKPPLQKSYEAPGRNGVAFLKVMARTMEWMENISSYDYTVLSRLADVMGGGGITGGMTINEAYLLELERATFLKLLREEKTLERITHYFEKGKVLRN